MKTNSSFRIFKFSTLASLGIALGAAVVLPLPAKADVVTQLVVPITITVTIDCDQDGIPEDIVPLSGNLYILVTTTNNNTITQMKTQLAPRELTGTGLITGANYVGSGITQTMTTTFKGAFSGSYILSFVTSFDVIGGDSGFKYLVHDNIHMTVFSNGSVISNVDNPFVICGR
jgi:hypothetical protein